jgi:MtfA peptidase
MQVIYKLDVIFLIVYSALILIVGAAFSIASGKWILMSVASLIEAIYLFFSLKHPYNRYRALKNPLPDRWKQIINAYSVFYRDIDDTSKIRFEKDIRIFLSDFTIESIRRHDVDLKTKLLVASGFAAMLNGRPYWEPPIKDGVLVYPGETFNRHYQIGRGNRAGQASINSPLIVTEESLKESFERANDGYNVIYHELAHYFDMEDGVADGVPSARLLPHEQESWKAIIHDEWEKAFSGESFMRSYASTNEAELFAVAVEYFFEDPQLMYENSPELYYALRNFFTPSSTRVFDFSGGASRTIGS